MMGAYSQEKDGERGNKSSCGRGMVAISDASYIFQSMQVKGNILTYFSFFLNSRIKWVCPFKVKMTYTSKQYNFCMQWSNNGNINPIIPCSLFGLCPFVIVQITKVTITESTNATHLWNWYVQMCTQSRKPLSNSHCNQYRQKLYTYI